MKVPVDLPDVNVWLALTDDRHVHHHAAQLYWNE
jgi:predicted nucleic acid-binding protein